MVVGHVPGKSALVLLEVKYKTFTTDMNLLTLIKGNFGFIYCVFITQMSHSGCSSNDCVGPRCQPGCPGSAPFCDGTCRNGACLSDGADGKFILIIDI